MKFGLAILALGAKRAGIPIKQARCALRGSNGRQRIQGLMSQVYYDYYALTVKWHALISMPERSSLALLRLSDALYAQSDKLTLLTYLTLRLTLRLIRKVTAVWSDLEYR